MNAHIAGLREKTMMIENLMILLIVLIGFIVPLLILTFIVEVLVEIRERRAWRPTLQDLARRGK